MNQRKQEYTGFRIDLDTKKLHPKQDLLLELQGLLVKLNRDGFKITKDDLERALGKIIFVGRCSLVGKSKTLNLYKALNSGQKYLSLNGKCKEEIKFWASFTVNDPGLPMGFAVNLPCTYT